MNIFDEAEVDPLAGNESINPEWSWDHVRTYVSIRHAGDYTQDQINTLAAQDIVMLEKMNGNQAHGSTEQGAIRAARRIKRVNPKTKTLFYLNAMCHYNGYRANAKFKDEWAMFDSRKDEYFKWRDRLLCYDHTNEEFREWWIQRALSMLVHDEIDGIFIDAICKTNLRQLPVKNHGEAYLATAKELRARLPEGKILIGNALRANSGKDGNLSHLRYLDGSYLENWFTPPNLAPTLELMSAALKQGRIVMLNGEPKNIDEGEFKELESLDDRYEYAGKSQFIGLPLGYFLLVVQPGAYFSYHVGVDAKNAAECVFDNNRFEEITRKLGKPVADYEKIGDHVYTREFEHVKVRVNLVTRNGVLTVKDGKGEEL